MSTSTYCIPKYKRGVVPESFRDVGRGKFLSWCRFLLRAAKDRSETTAVAIVGLTCYSSRDMLASRAYVAQHGESLVKLWKKE